MEALHSNWHLSRNNQYIMSVTLFCHGRADTVLALLKVKTCGATRNPEFPRTETGPGSGHIFKNIFGSGRVGEFYFGPVRVGNVAVR